VDVMVRLESLRTELKDSQSPPDPFTFTVSEINLCSLLQPLPPLVKPPIQKHSFSPFTTGTLPPHRSSHISNTAGNVLSQDSDFWSRSPARTTDSSFCSPFFTRTLPPHRSSHISDTAGNELSQDSDLWSGSRAGTTDSGLWSRSHTDAGSVHEHRGHWSEDEPMEDARRDIFSHHPSTDDTNIGDTS